MSADRAISRMRRLFGRQVVDRPGWTLDASGRHPKLVYNGGGMVTLCWSPSDHRTIKNTLSQMLRLERGTPT